MTSSWLYQIEHPWHWLTYGQNAAALQASCALFALVGLTLYTLYTRRMMKLGELTRRASITPVFTMKDATPHYVNQDSDAVCRVSMTIRNIGEGPAAIIWAWHQPVTPKFSVFDAGIVKQSPSAQPGYVPESDLLKGDSMEIHFDAYDLANPTVKQVGFLTQAFPKNLPWLFVVDSIDQAGGRHQLKILRHTGDNAPTDVTMQHSLGDTFGERWMKFVTRTVEILQFTKSEIAKLFK